MITLRDKLEAQLDDIKEAVDWAREICANELEGQYTSDAALHLALFALAESDLRMTDAEVQARQGRKDTLP